jgi:hypothetical protein
VQALAVLATLGGLAMAALAGPPRGEPDCAREACRCLCVRGAPGGAACVPLL